MDKPAERSGSLLESLVYAECVGQQDENCCHTSLSHGRII